MANPFDQFDSTASKPQKDSENGKASGPNPFDIFDGLTSVPEKSYLKKAVGSAMPYIRPVVEGGLAAAGGIVGSGAAPVAGTIAGGALGYGIGKQAVDRAEEWAGTKKSPSAGELAVGTAGDLATGALYEVGGLALAPVFSAVKSGGKWLFKNIKEPIAKQFTKKGMEKAAGEVLKASTSAGDIYAKNASEARKLERQIPGLKFTSGQATGDPGLIKLERSQARKPGVAADIGAEQTASNNEALRTYYEKQFGGEGGVDDLISSLRKQGESAKSSAEAAEASASMAVSGIPSSKPEETGQKIIDVLSEGRATAKSVSKEKYKEVPEIYVDVSGMVDDFNSIVKPMSKYEDEGNIPKIIGRVVSDFNSADHANRNMSLSDLRGLRSEITADLRQAKSSLAPNERLAARLSRAVSAIDDSIKAAESKEVSGALKEANRFYKEDYAGVFKSGTVGDILRRGPRGEQTRIPISQVPSKVWNSRNLSAADDFIRATPQASGIIRDHAAYDLMQSVTDSSGKVVTSKLNQWFAKNRRLLDKFGISGEFKGIEAAQAASDAAAGSAREFEKSVAGRILGSDPDKAIATAFSGRDAGKQAETLMRMVKSDKAAKAGLQKAFADHMMDQIRTTAKDVAGNPIISNAALDRVVRKYAPVMRVIYREDPKKIKALNTMKRAYEVTVRNTRSPIGGGSDTAENIMTELGKANLLSRKVSIIKAFIRVFSKHSDAEINDMVTRGLFDPEYASVLIGAARGDIPMIGVEKLLSDARRTSAVSQTIAGMAAAADD